MGWLSKVFHVEHFQHRAGSQNCSTWNIPGLGLVPNSRFGLGPKLFHVEHSWVGLALKSVPRGTFLLWAWFQIVPRGTFCGLGWFPNCSTWNNGTSQINIGMLHINCEPPSHFLRLHVPPGLKPALTLLALWGVETPVSLRFYRAFRIEFCFKL